MAHPIVHIEIPAGDTQALGQFYQDVFGWKLELDTNFNYLQFEATGGPGGAFMGTESGPESPMQYEIGKPLIYLGTDDVDGDLARITEAGGTVLAPTMEIPGMGWFAIFRDPAGNQMALYKSMRH